MRSLRLFNKRKPHTIKQVEQLNDRAEIIVTTLSLKKQMDNNNKNRLHMRKIEYAKNYITQVHT